MGNKITQVASLKQYHLYWDFCCAIGQSIQPANFHEEVIPLRFLLQPVIYHSFKAVDEDSYPLLLTLMLRWWDSMWRFHTSCWRLDRQRPMSWMVAPYKGNWEKVRYAAVHVLKTDIVSKIAGLIEIMGTTKPRLKSGKPHLYIGWLFTFFIAEEFVSTFFHQFFFTSICASNWLLVLKK